jgi:hypothetical protein
MIRFIATMRAFPLSSPRIRATKELRNRGRRAKDADPDIPILKEAKAEYAKLQ